MKGHLLPLMARELRTMEKTLRLQGE